MHTIVGHMLYDTKYSQWLGILHSTVTEDIGFPIWTSLPFSNPYGLAFLLAHVSLIHTELTFYFTEFLQIIFALKKFIQRMRGRTPPVVAYPEPKGSLSDEERVAIQKITNKLELVFQSAILGIPGSTREERTSIRRAYHKLASRSSQFPFRTCPLAPSVLRTSTLERLHIH